MRPKLLVWLLATVLLITAPPAAAQQPKKVPKIAFLAGGSRAADSLLLEAFWRRMNELGEGACASQCRHHRGAGLGDASRQEGDRYHPDRDNVWRPCRSGAGCQPCAPWWKRYRGVRVHLRVGRKTVGAAQGSVSQDLPRCSPLVDRPKRTDVGRHEARRRSIPCDASASGTALCQ